MRGNTEEKSIYMRQGGTVRRRERRDGSYRRERGGEDEGDICMMDPPPHLPAS